MTINEAIDFCENEAKRIERKGCSEWVQDLQIKESANRFRQLAEWLRTLKDVKTAIKVGNKLLDQDGCDHEMAFDVYSSIYCQIEKLVEEVKADDGT